jgi:hypothetical protein
MGKLLTLGVIICLGLPGAAWGQAVGEAEINKAGVEYMGAKKVEKQCPASSAKPGPFACPYPPSPYPPTPSVPPMAEMQQGYQSNLDQYIQQLKPTEEDETKKKAIEKRYQEKDLK